MTVRDDRYAHDLLSTCQRLHASTTGSGDPLGEDEAYALVEWLQHRLDTWIESDRWYDRKAKDLAAAAVAEYWRQQAEWYTHGPKLFCVTPSGRRDGHGTRVKFGAPGHGSCSFCGRPISATPAHPEGLRVTAVAIQLRSGKVLSLPAPARHHHIIQAYAEANPHRQTFPKRAKQGFLLNDGSFVDRKRAHYVARAAGQLLDRAPTAGHWEGGLYSEDCW